jgi:pSer/pThr/pTyr-binding forkhead associated (FHA) protein
VLHRDIAYPISDAPLGISSEKGGTQIHILKDSEGASSRHCTIRRQGKQVVLTNLSRSGTLLDGVKITGSTPLTRGQKIKTGESEEALQLIACLQKDET